jgi:hypothetical protein
VSAIRTGLFGTRMPAVRARRPTTSRNRRRATTTVPRAVSGSFFFAVVGDALLFAALAWFAGYGALGPAIGLRLTVAQKLRLFAEVFALTALILTLFINVDSLLGWDRNPPWPGSPPPPRLVAIAALLAAGFLYARRRSRAMDAAGRTEDE